MEYIDLKEKLEKLLTEDLSNRNTLQDTRRNEIAGVEPGMDDNSGKHRIGQPRDRAQHGRHCEKYSKPDGDIERRGFEV